MQMIPLTNGGFTLVDDDDFAEMSKYQWRSNFNVNTGTYYAVSGHGVERQLHRLIVGAKDGELVDHKNHDTLDNQKANLRKATASQNMQNRSGATNISKTGIRGVYRLNTGNLRYRAQVRKDYRIVYSKCFATIEEAANAVRKAREQHFTHSTG